MNFSNLAITSAPYWYHTYSGNGFGLYKGIYDRFDTVMLVNKFMGVIACHKCKPAIYIIFYLIDWPKNILMLSLICLTQLLFKNVLHDKNYSFVGEGVPEDWFS